MRSSTFVSLADDKPYLLLLLLQVLGPRRNSMHTILFVGRAASSNCFGVRGTTVVVCSFPAHTWIGFPDIVLY